MTLGTPSEVRRIAELSIEEFSDTTAAAYLSAAERNVRAYLGRLLVLDRVFIKRNPTNGILKLNYSLYFPVKSVADIARVLVNDVILSSSNYTFDSTINEITFTSTGVKESDTVVVYYKPDFLDDYVNYMAAAEVLRTKMVNTWNGAQNNVVFDRVNDKAMEYKKELESKPVVVGWVDHFDDTLPY